MYGEGCYGKTKMKGRWFNMGRDIIEINKDIFWHLIEGVKEQYGQNIAAIKVIFEDADMVMYENH